MLSLGNKSSNPSDPLLHQLKWSLVDHYTRFNTVNFTKIFLPEELYSILVCVIYIWVFTTCAPARILTPYQRHGRVKMREGTRQSPADEESSFLRHLEGDKFITVIQKQEVPNNDFPSLYTVYSACRKYSPPPPLSFHNLKWISTEL